MKPHFRKSKYTIVIQWIVRNAAVIGVSKNASACDIHLSQNGDNFTFTWMGISGEVSCKKRVLTSSLKLTNK